VKILVITYLFPYPPDGGYKLRVFNSIRELSVQNRVDLLCFEDRDIDELHLEKMETYCGMVRLGKKPQLSFSRKAYRYLKDITSAVPVSLVSSWDREKIRLIREITEKTVYDAIIAEHLLAGHLVHQCNGFPEEKAVTAIINHNVEHHLYESINSGKYSFLRPYHHLQSRAMRRYEKKVNELFDIIVVMSEEDRRMFRELSPGLEPVVLPNAVDLELFFLRRSLPSNHDFYYAGNLNYYPNSDAVRHFMEEVFLLVRSAVPDCRFFIIGGNPPKEVSRFHNGKNVIVTGYLEDIRNLTGNCRASVVPLRLGSGTRLKIVEAMSMGIPVVSTGKGAEGLDVTDGLDIMLADKPEEFALKLAALLKDDSIALRIGLKGRELVENRYSWARIVGKFQDVLAQEAVRA
jgi:glycosyltransferase involved in cell wall biosynthesis